MRIAYLLLIHNNPNLFRRTIATLWTKNCGFFVHVDRKSNIRPFTDCDGPKATFCEPRVPVYWSEFSQIEATLCLIKQALKDPSHFDYVVFLQGSTYPLRSGPYIESYFTAHSECQFMNLTTMPAPGYPISKISIRRYPSTQPIRRTLTRILARAGLARRNYQKQLGDLLPYSGHACWGLSRAACEYAVNFVSSRQDIVKFFHHTFVPEESFFQTIIGNSLFYSKTRKLFVYADWSLSEGHHPQEINQYHLDLFRATREFVVEDEWGKGEMLFARKFSDKHLHVVDQVDEMIRRKDRLQS